MALPQLTLTDPNNIPIQTLDFGIIDAGSQGPGIPVRIWNNYGGAANISDALNTVITTKTYNNLDSGDSIQNGNEVILNSMVQAQCVSSGQTNYTAIGGPTVLSIADAPPGNGNPPPPPTIHNGNYADMLLNIVVPPTASAGNISFLLSVSFQYT